MEHAREVQFRGQLQRDESVAGDPERGQGLVVGARAEHVGQHHGVGVLGLQRVHHGVHHVARERDLQPDVLELGLEAHLVTRELLELLHHQITLIRQEPHVHGALRGPGDHVRLVPAVEHRGVRGVLQGRPHEPGHIPQFAQQPLRVLRIELHAGQLGDLVQERAGGLGQFHGPRVLPDVRHGAGQVRHGVVLVQPGAVPGLALRDELQPQQALLRGLQQVGPLAADVRGEPAHLAQCVRETVEDLGMFAHHPLGAVAHPGFLVREEPEDDVPLGHGSRAAHVAQHREHHGVHVLHVHRAAAPDHPVPHLPCERVQGPVLRRGGDHVQVAVHEQRVRARVLALDTGEHVRAARGGLEVLGLEAHLVDQLGHVLSRRTLTLGLATRVIARVEADQLAADPGGLALRCGIGLGVLGHGARSPH